MDRLGPFGPARRVAVAVSGGADSMALAWLASFWGQPLALIVDHGLRPGSDGEAAETLRRLRERGVVGRVLTLRRLCPGSGLQARARQARYAALAQACESAGLADLLLGHHAGDQAETVAMRRAGGSGPAGLAGMAALTVPGPVRLLRPLLGIAPGRLRATLRAAALEWVEDPTNADPRFTRARIRLAGAGEAPGDAGQRRAADEAGAWPGVVSVYPAGFAGVPFAAPRALRAAVWTVSGRGFPPPEEATRRAAASPTGGTLHGTRVLPGRAQLFVVREEAATAAPGTARTGFLWDGRFRVERCDEPDPPEVGVLGNDAARLRRVSGLPSAVLRTFPALRRNGRLWAVPHLTYPDAMVCASVRIAFRPAHPIAGSPFVPFADGLGVHLRPELPMSASDGGRSAPGGGLHPARPPKD